MLGGVILKKSNKNIRIRMLIFFIFVIIIGIFDFINISNIIRVPFGNINLDLWNILIVIILFIITYEIIDRRENNRKINQEEIAAVLLKETYKSCFEYIKLIDSQEFKAVCPKRFPGDQTMENNSAYHNLRNAPFEYDSNIFALSEQGIISYSDIKQYIEIKNQYHVFLTNAIVFSDIENMIEPLKSRLELSLNKAMKCIDETIN